MFDKLRKAMDGFVSRITHKSITEKNLQDALSELQIALLANDVALEAAEKIGVRVSETLLGEEIGRL